ncbi:hypothetical protein RGUI_2003 [Rhodovulum sp. P5]|uniref:DUF3141 domain-containing protein n=1 Tax=Rhodovulum sp. P5 TaxID=1564506 RepID=UPI0009C1D0E3|nr:DUF3141 domain-containing protein [Rhodovulum sp. P5]ARE40144.1 hypothetical protein RGUI_2003 [Rhodovulum sp. P5]
MANSTTIPDPTETLDSLNKNSEIFRTAATRHVERAQATMKERSDAMTDRATGLAESFGSLSSPQAVAQAWSDYAKDASQRAVLFADALRARADMLVDHNKDYGAKPVLVYDSELVMDGADLPRPCNYFLLRILPPEGVTVDESKRPYVIIDPRAGHGAGIGGFKRESQVGVALAGGHPVYFVAFHQMPEPHQTLAMVTEAEAAFLREIERLHPDAPKPVVIGNCQGGWATAILAATNPDLTGPIVLNGAPMSYWSGKVGQDPMRYSGGLSGGVVPAMIAGDLGGGIFDGANLVMNFEGLNPGRTWFKNYFDLYQNIDRGVPRFLDFEKWWGGFYLMTTEEITWIVENLFVGNKLSKNMAQIEPGRPIDLKRIKAPVICFASHGDNITPPGQALNWIVDTYASEQEIEIRGQRILYMLHEEVGHLGIFVSSSIANREHSQMAETLANIEALAPGLYEIMIEDTKGEGDQKHFKLSIARRKFSDIVEATGGRAEEAAFAAVARGSEALAEVYDATLRPFLVKSATRELGEMQRKTNPMRVTREIFASSNPAMKPVALAAEQARENRTPADKSNPFRQAELLWGEVIETAWNNMRDMREAMMELGFLGFYLSPLPMLYGAKRNHERTRKDPGLLSQSPEVKMHLNRMGEGGLAEGLIRMLILLAGTRGDVRADRLARSLETLHEKAPLKDLTVDQRVAMIHSQTVIAHFAPDEAFDTLSMLLRTPTDRKKALDMVIYVVGAEDEMAPETKAMMQRFRDVLGQPETKPVAETSAAE